jgi:secondary thiamine-phosphate synthase enzyme
MTVYEELDVRTNQRSHWIDITSRVQKVISNSGIAHGICVVSSPHTTAGVTINENADPAVGRDFFWKLNAVFPQDDGYRHAEMNSDSHIKASLVGFSVQIPFRGGRLKLGTWQGIYLCEFDGPRSRRVSVSAVGDGAEGAR